jgi:hypothetical protein
MRIALLTAIMLFSIDAVSYAQQDSLSKMEKVLNFPGRMFSKARSSTAELDNQVKSQLIRYLQRLSNRERKLEKEVYAQDSAKAKALFNGTEQQYQHMISELNAPPTANLPHPMREYIPLLDSMQTAMSFMNSSATRLPGFPAGKLAQIQQINAEIQQLEARLQSAGSIQQYIAQREQQLKSQLPQQGFASQLSSYNKQAYYYQQQLEEYKSMLKDPKKLEEKMLATLSTLPAFQQFMEKHSYLSALFGLPANYGSEASAYGLQTKALVAKEMNQKLGGGPAGGVSASGDGGSGGASNPTQLMQGQMQAAQQKLQSLQNKLGQLGMGSGSSSGVVMPDFTPNGQKTKNFLRRLQFGYNLQTQKTNSLMPATTSIGLSVGYKLDDKKIIGVGGSYNVGWGNDPIKKIAFSSQGVGIRSFADIKFKGSLWITGGFEYDYLQQLANIYQLYNLDVWQKSALLGLSKKYQLTRDKGGNLQVLYDFLYRDHIPASPPVIFRFGFSL